MLTAKQRDFIAQARIKYYSADSSGKKYDVNDAYAESLELHMSGKLDKIIPPALLGLELRKQSEYEAPRAVREIIPMQEAEHIVFVARMTLGRRYWFGLMAAALCMVAGYMLFKPTIGPNDIAGEQVVVIRVETNTGTMTYSKPMPVSQATGLYPELYQSWDIHADQKAIPPMILFPSDRQYPKVLRAN